MQARCPHCTTIFPTEISGVQPCPACRQPINVPAPPGAPEPLGAFCVRHPDRGASGACPRCGNFTCARCQGQGGLCPACSPLGLGQVAFAPTPWERRDELGLFPALWLTWKSSLFEPEKFWSSLKPDGPTSDALFYAWSLTLLAAVPTFAMNLLNFKNLQAQLTGILAGAKEIPPELQKFISAVGEHATSAALGLTVTTVLLLPVALLISASVIHLGCLIFGAGKNGFGATFRVVAYASAPTVLAWIPMVGAVTGIYVLVLQVWGLLRVQQTTVGRSLGAVFGLPLLLACCACGLMATAIAGAMGSR